MSYDVYDNGVGSNIVKSRQWHHTTDNIETLRSRMETMLTKRARNAEGKRYKHLSICFTRKQPKDAPNN